MHMLKGCTRCMRAEIPPCAQAGLPGAVTIATNMAGRGTDICLGGDPQGLLKQWLRQAWLASLTYQLSASALALAQCRVCVLAPPLGGHVQLVYMGVQKVPAMTECRVRLWLAGAALPEHTSLSAIQSGACARLHRRRAMLGCWLAVCCLGR